VLGPGIKKRLGNPPRLFRERLLDYQPKLSLRVRRLYLELGWRREVRYVKASAENDCVDRTLHTVVADNGMLRTIRDAVCDQLTLG